jgi:hypothetical protein
MPMSPRLLRPRASGGFDPRSISGLQAWWTPFDLATLSQTSDGTTAITGNSQPVAYIRDRVNGYVLTQTTNNNRPNYLSAGINGYPALDFDGVNDALFTSSGGATGIARNVGGVTIFAVSNLDANGSGTFLPLVFFSTGVSAASTRSSLAVGDLGRFWAAGRRVDGGSVSGAIGSTTAALGTSYVCCAALNYSGQVARIFVNGSVDATNSIFHDGGNTADTDSLSVCLFGVNNGAQNLLDGRLGDALVYNRLLSDTEISTVSRWLGSRYGVTVA